MVVVDDFSQLANIHRAVVECIDDAGFGFGAFEVPREPKWILELSGDWCHHDADRLLCPYCGFGAQEAE